MTAGRFYVCLRVVYVCPGAGGIKSSQLEGLSRTL